MKQTFLCVTKNRYFANADAFVVVDEAIGPARGLIEVIHNPVVSRGQQEQLFVCVLSNEYLLCASLFASMAIERSTGLLHRPCEGLLSSS